MSNATRRTSAGNATTGRTYLKSVVLTHTAAAGELSVTDATAGGGTVILQLRCAADGSCVWRSGDKRGLFFGAGVRAESLTGAASFEYE